MLNNVPAVLAAGILAVMSASRDSAHEGVVVAATAPLAKVTSDFDFLQGSFDVLNRQLIAPLSGRDEWAEFPAVSVARTHFNGAISVDEMRFPTKGSYGMSIRLYEPATQLWTVYWVNSDTGTLQAPVRGRWVDGVSMLFGDDEHDGRPVHASYRWSDVTERTARWEQGFSPDGGQTWETNWVMHWTRRADEPPGLPAPKITSDFDFLIGRWRVAHRTLTSRLSGSGEWAASSGLATSRTYFNGAVSIDEFHFPAAGSRGLAIRLFNPGTKRWSIYWVSSRDGVLQPPVHGGFSDGVGEFYGDDLHDGRPIRVRFIWSGITDRSARWEQAFSIDGGTTWEVNWVMIFTRVESEPE